MIERFKGILKECGLTGKKFCSMLGDMTYDSYRSMTRSGGRVIPKWVRAFVVGFELGRDNCGCEKKIDDPSGIDK